MKSNHTGKKTGFILASIHTGSSLKLWLNLAAHASRQSGAFFIFPGGRLDNQKGSEYLRNSVYSLANSQNLDGVISWASSIGGSVTAEELERFHDTFSDIPFVTIGQKIKNYPCVNFDAYTGMKELVQHFIKVHGCKKIAFIRGPLNHSSAEERFKAYLDALKESGLYSDDVLKLVSTNVSWSNGEAAIRELYEDRGLVPGTDFDALVCCSDMMSFSAVKWLEQRGFKVPRDLLVSGFNDSVECHVFNSPLSTVHMPYEELGLEAYNQINQVYCGTRSVQDISLAAYSVVRESCGCNNLKSWVSSPEPKVFSRSRNEITQELVDQFRCYSDNIENIIEGLLDALFENDQATLFNLLSNYLNIYFNKDYELTRLFTAISILRSSNSLSREYVSKVIRTINIMISQIQGRVSASKFNDNKYISSIMSALKSDLLSVHDRESLIKKLSIHLPTIGIRSVSVVLYENDSFSRFVGGFDDAGILNNEEVLFPAKLLVPAKQAEKFNVGTFVVQPLFMENQPLGYVICGYSDCDGSIYEDLRSTISSTLQSIFLFEETTNAKRIAEQAEFAKTEFFANVGSDLCDPLKDLSSKVTQMELNVDKGILDQDILSEQLIFLKSQIEAQLEKTETLVDLTRSQVDDLPMDKKLFDIRQVLPGSAVAAIDTDLPLLYGDPDRLKKALQTIFEYTGTVMSVTAEVDGLEIYIESSNLDWTKAELLLAEKIILLQYGTVVKSETSATIILPWPNLSGMPPVKPVNKISRVYSLSGKAQNEQIFHMDVSQVTKEMLEDTTPESANLLYWEPDEAPIDEWIKVYSLRHYENLFRSPVICYSHNLVGHSFVEMLEQKVRTQKSAPVLFVNAKHTRYGTWATDSNSVSIPSMEDFDRILSEIKPSLIVFETIDEASIKKIRQNNKTVLVPIIVLPDTILSEEQVELLCSHPRIILCNRGAAESDQFNDRVHAILNGDEILPPHTGALVKKAILYLNKNASQQIVRWKLADTVHVSEDYLTRIFHKEIGLSLWEYLNRYRIYLATKMLLETNATIYEIAENSGFQDQAYFCRVFKKIYGVPPGKIRQKQ